MKRISSGQYLWWRDNKMVATIYLIIISTMQVFAFLRMPVLTTMHAYTIGMLVGYYNPLVYLCLAFLCLKIMVGTHAP